MTGQTQRYQSDKPHRDRDTLRKLYIEQDFTMQEIADKLGVSDKTICKYINRYNIQKYENKGDWFKGGAPDTPAGFGTYTKHPGKTAYEIWTDNVTNQQFRVHRLLAVAEYGIDAVKDKHVHHKNNIGWDNRPDNIAVMTPSAHSKLHSAGVE